MKPVKLFTHTDLDGTACNILARLYFPHVSVTYVNYNNVNQQVEQYLSNKDHYESCYITDISIGIDLAEKIDHIPNHNIQLFDHHETAASLNQYNWCHIKCQINNTLTCGTELFAKYLSSKELYQKNIQTTALNAFIQLVCDWDTYAWKNKPNGELAHQLNMFFQVYGQKIFTNWCLKKLKRQKFPKFNDIEHAILNTEKHRMEQYLKVKEKTMSIHKTKHYTIGIVFAEEYISEIGDQLNIKHPELDFIMLINLASNVISFRTIHNSPHLGKDVASLFNGGGHQKAAGCKIEPKFHQNLINDIVSKL